MTGFGAALERTIMSLVVFVGGGALLLLAPPEHFQAILAMIGPLMGAVGGYWFAGQRQNGHNHA